MKTSLKKEIAGHTTVEVDRCYQCGKCSAGCPLNEEMDYPPSYLMRMLQTGDPALEDQVLRSFSIWVCLTCETCYSRCPMSIEIPQMMDYLRQQALIQGKVNPKARKIVAFHKSFLKSLRYTGRLYELGLVMDYKLHTGNLLQDMKIAPAMMASGKLSIVPEMLKDRKAMPFIFSRTLNKKK